MYFEKYTADKLTWPKYRPYLTLIRESTLMYIPETISVHVAQPGNQTWIKLTHSQFVFAVHTTEQESRE